MGFDLVLSKLLSEIRHAESQMLNICAKLY